MNKNTLFILRFMRITFSMYAMVMIFSQMLLARESEGQVLSKSVSVSFRNISLYEAIQQLQKKEKIDIAFDEAKLALRHRKIDKLILENTRLEQILFVLLDHEGIDFEKIGTSGLILFKRQQPGTISGVVTDSDSQTLSGATIKVVETGRSYHTDPDGRYSITLQPGTYTLEVSYVSFETQQKASLKVGEGQNIPINFTLNEVKSTLDEVVVVGYGTQKKTDLTGSVASVPVKTLREAPVVNFSNSLAGRLPGVFAVNGSGEPGYDGSSILIRGNHSLNNNAPLLVVDGVINPNSVLERINPNDIENVSVLKDATASIYGSQAANGVILITTKRGEKNQPARFSLRFDQGFSQPTRVPELAGAIDYMEMLNEAMVYHGTTAQFTEEEIAAYKEENRDPWLYPETDWYKEGLKNLSPQTNGNLSVSGGTDKLTYFLSLGGLTEDAFYKNSATRYNQYNFRSNIANQVTKSIKLGLDLNGRLEDRNFPTVSAGQIFRLLMRGRPTDPAYFPNGLPGPDMAEGNQPVVTGTSATGSNRDKQYYLTGNLSMTITIPGLEGFDISGLFSYNKEFQQKKLWQTPWTLYSFDKASYINNGMQDPEQFLHAYSAGPTDPSLTQTFYQQEKTMENVVANYNRSFGLHDFGLMAGVELQQFGYNTFNAYRRGFVSTSISELFAGSQANWSNGGSSADGSRLSYFGRLDYAFDHKYLFQFVGRYDGSYLFPEDQRFGFFPAVSAGWRISQESFFRDHVNFANDLKLRASWGRTGNDIINANSLVEGQQYLSGFQFGSGYVFGQDQVVQSITPSNVANPYITWEKADQLDLGIDGVLLANRLNFTFDYWHQMRSGILISRNASIPQSAGLTLPRENLGKVKSWGYDGNITWNQKLNRDFSFNVSLNGGYATTSIVFWDEPAIAPDYQRSTGLKTSTSLYYKAIGIFQTQEDVEKYPHWTGARPGDVIYEDMNGDGKIDANDQVRINKNNTPTVTGGLSLGANWKQLSVNVLFQGAAGAVQYVSTESGDIGNYLADFAEQRWKPDPSDPTGMTPDPTKSYYSGPRTFDRGDVYWTGSNSYFLRSTDYLRLKSVQIGYDLPDTTGWPKSEWKISVSTPTAST